MRLALAVAAFLLATSLPSFAQIFSGTGASETTVFTVKDRWQVHFSGTAASVTVEDANGAALSGMSSRSGGTLYMPTGGSYKVRVMPHAGVTGSWQVVIDQAGAPGGTVNADTAAYVPPDMTEVGTAAPPPAPAEPPANPGGSTKLTPAQAAAFVLIRGDNAEGTGFLIKTAAGPFVVTNQHVIGANPHLQITTADGASVKFSGLQIAIDRDLAMIPVQDANYSYLEVAADVGGTVQVGDQVLTPGNSEGGGVMLPCTGVVLAMGPQKIEISNPVYHGNSGGPIFHIKSGKVIGVVTEGLKVDTGNALDSASFANNNSPIQGQMRYFGLRLDNVPKWDDGVWMRFETETEFLREFHERSKCLDSYVNTGTIDVSEWGTYFARDDKIKTANEQYAETIAGADSSQRLQAAQELVFNLEAVADDEMDQIQNPSNFYSYDQQRAKDEIDYRKALRVELENMKGDLNRAGGLARPLN
jgi:S1-C subfamily serine protease